MHVKLDDALMTHLDKFVERYHELTSLLSDPSVIADQNLFTNYSRELSQLQEMVECYEEFNKLLKKQESANLLLEETDLELRQLAQEEINQYELEMKELYQKLQILLLPKDPDDHRNVYLEIRAGAGGDEAAIFVGNLFRMYAKYVEREQWQIEVVSSSPSEMGGFKEVISRIAGKNVYAKLKFESGTHRVQRVPETEAQGRVHTSTCTIAILPEVEAIDHIDIRSEDLRIDTYRASGAGGQHVNKTDSAIRITHLPTGIVVECQDERSQHKNRSKALSLLQSRLLAAEQSKQKKEQEDERRSLVGTGDRSERIRTYNYPQNRVTDHRINLTLYKLDEIMEGSLNQIIEPLVQYDHRESLAKLGINSAGKSRV